METAGDILL